MITIEALLQRIRWDPDFGRGSFTVGYHDRLRREVVTVPLKQIHPTPGNHFAFTAVEPDVGVEGHAAVVRPRDVDVVLSAAGVFPGDDDRAVRGAVVGD